MGRADCYTLPASFTQPLLTSLVGRIVMIVVIGLPVVTINGLHPFSRWETPHPEEPPRN
jgi:hypothetical protein